MKNSNTPSTANSEKKTLGLLNKGNLKKEYLNRKTLFAPFAVDGGVNSSSYFFVAAQISERFLVT